MIKIIKGKNLAFVLLTVICLVFGGAAFYFWLFQPCGVFGGMPAKEASARLLEFINKKVLQGVAEAKLSGEVKKMGCLYAFQVEVAGNKYDSYLTKDGKLFFPQVINIEEEMKKGTAKESGSTLGFFSVSSDEICREEGKPIIYFFGSQSCPHCRWEHPLIQKVADKFKKQISFHDNMDKEADSAVFQKYSTGGVPTLVLGCKYFRVGSGENSGEEKELQNLTALICSLTGNQPAEVCQEVEGLVNQINQ